MTRSLLALVLLSSVAAGCGPSIRLRVMKPALVTVPSHVQTIAVVDRSKAKNVGEGVIGVLEGIATGEGIGADTEGRKAATNSLMNTLNSSPRYEVMRPNISNKKLESSLFDKELSWDTADMICRQANCQGIVSLDAFDTDVVHELTVEEYTETDDKGRELHKKRHIAQREVTVLTAWRIYDVERRTIIDDVREFRWAQSWTESGPTRDAAMAALPPVVDTVRDVAWNAGDAFARRIAPTPIWVYRDYFGGGSPEMKQAKNWVKANDWEKAADIWERVYDNNPGKLGGKAAFNLALYNEVMGDLDSAYEWAQQAAGMTGKPKARKYVRTLQARKREAERLAAQMAPPPPPKPEPPPSPASDGEEKPLGKPANVDRSSSSSGRPANERSEDETDDEGRGTMSRPK